MLFLAAIASARAADVPFTVYTTTSADPNMGDLDAGNFLRADGQEMVLLDVQGPGELARLWTDKPMGALRFYFNGAPRPQFEARWVDIAEGKVPGLAPFVKAGPDGQGADFRAPITFEGGLRITLLGQTWCEWRADTRLFPPGTRVRTWSPDDKPRLDGTRTSSGFDGITEPTGKPTRTIGDASLFSAADPIVYTAPQDQLVSGLVFEHRGESVALRNLRLAVEGQGEASWSGFTGSNKAGNRSWSSVPFLLPGGQRITLSWDGDAAGEVTGRLHVYTATTTPPPPDRPRLWLQEVEWSGYEGLSPSVIRLPEPGRGRLLGINMSGSGLGDFLRETDVVYTDGGLPQVLATSLPSLAGGQGTYRVSPTRDKNGWKDFEVSAALLPGHGIPFEGSPEIRIHHGRRGGNMPMNARTTIVGQLYGAAEASVPGIAAIHDADTSTGVARVRPGAVAGGPPGAVADGPPGIVYTMAPESVQNVVSGDSLSGELTVTLSRPAQRLTVFLDLPYGWSGTLSGGGQSREVFDIGWPWIDTWSATPGEHRHQWTIKPPDPAAPPSHGHVVYPQGGHTAQLRVEVEEPGAPVRHYRRPFAVAISNPALTPVLVLGHADLHDGGFRIEPPFEGQPGDLLAVHLERPARALVTAKWDAGPIANDRGYAEAAAAMLPPDGELSLWAEHSDHLLFPVGQQQSWLGRHRRLSFTSTENGFGLDAVRVFRRFPLPTTEGWMRRVPYVESRPDTFTMPRNHGVLMGPALRAAMEIVSAMPTEGIDPHLRPADYLENVEAGPMRWRLSDPPTRPRILAASVSYSFRAEHTGSRIRITDPRITGRQFLGFEFGFGPECGTVGIRDCEGRLVAVQDLYLNEPRALPQWTWVALPTPSRDGWVYLEAMGRPPGSQAMHIPLQKFMIVNDLVGPP